MFTDTDSFYFCIDGAGLPADLTNTLQRHCDLPPATPRWKNIDKRFFWNKHMLKEVLLINVSLRFVLCFLLFLSVSFRLVVAIRAAVFWLLVQRFPVAYFPPNHLGAHSTNNQLSNYMFRKGNSENVKYPQTNTTKSQIKKKSELCSCCLQFYSRFSKFLYKYSVGANNPPKNSMH